MNTSGFAVGVTTGVDPVASFVKTYGIVAWAISPVAEFFTDASISYVPSRSMVVQSKLELGPKSTTVWKSSVKV
jgi:hypothetical protein